MERCANSKDSARIKKMFLAGPPPFVTAQSWIVADGRNGKLIFGRGETERREIASLTKIMTAYTALQLTKKFQLIPNQTIVTISDNASFVEGTSAMLEEGDQLTLKDLMHGMMLPSGNDAALAIAEFFGSIIKNSLFPKMVPEVDDEEEDKKVSPVKLFVKEMNSIAMQLGLKDTIFANPHGLINSFSKSSASDIAKLSCVAMKNNDFKSIVNCRRYLCKAKNSCGQDKKFRWRNTNKLLGKGYSGIKTGITNSAGPCLVTSIEKDNLSLIIVVLNSKTMDQRWHEIQKLTKWAIAQIGKFEQMSINEAKKNKKKLMQMLPHI